MSIITVPTSSYRTFPSLLGSKDFFDLLSNSPAFDMLQRKATQGYPVADIFVDDAGSTIMEFALAGFSKEDLNIEVNPEKQTITVSSQTKEAEGDAHRRIARRAFTKTYVNYNSNLDLARTSAKFENGLLAVTIPVRPESKSLNVTIG